MSNENREAVVALDIILHEAERDAQAECGGACGSPNCASINARRNAALAHSEVERLRQAERERDEARRALADANARLAAVRKLADHFDRHDRPRSVHRFSVAEHIRATLDGPDKENS